jgi:hypothetical protein
MITLHEDKNYYILVDGQGGTFGGYRILEGEQEVFEQFKEWADSDGMEDPTLKNYTFADLIEIWAIDIKKYNGAEFVELTDREINTTNK